MKTIEELEAELETVTRERNLSLSAWESAGMQGRTAQSAMLELARQLEEARQEVAEVNAVLEDISWLEDERDKARAWAHRAERERDEARAEIAILTTALDERDLEAERGLEQYDSLVRERDRLREQVVTVNNNIETFQKETWRYKHERDEARAEVERLSDASTHWQVMLKREMEEVERLKLSARLWADDIDAVSNAYRRGAEAMREACASAFDKRDEHDLTVDVIHDVLVDLPIPEEP
jgi:chromosome segregation ATPase